MLRQREVDDADKYQLLIIVGLYCVDEALDAPSLEHKAMSWKHKCAHKATTKPRNTYKRCTEFCMGERPLITLRLALDMLSCSNGSSR